MIVVDEPTISYERLVERALRGVLRDALRIAERDGLPGQHHYYITFSTDHPDVSLAPHLRAQHAEVMTIVLQHQFWSLKVTEDWFEVDLSFNGRTERLHIPFEAVTAFADPFAKFGLQFQIDLDAAEDGDLDEEDGESLDSLFEETDEDLSPVGNDDTKPAEDGKVVTLDAFRKK